MFLAGIWGPILVVIGFGLFLNRSHYARLYRNLENEPLSLFVVGLATMAAGITHISYHNTWETLVAGIVSALGWALFIKGVLLTLVPRVADSWGDHVAASKLLPAAVAVAALLGAYLVMFAYL